ncbi:class I SAM-dependent methyltransferase [Alkalimonas sp. MEB108]|uniref:Class I SAM-dependent methyltransferase n=1 Tax=Alkalimonas cellulosilytica TaxID=3058395 RepID=A0ABU7J568_9GAMM|nr:class I SAM-dependent methyltransferase [Alkalimonas sp. MEB108]MEE2001666.1 class I SAM-dependent methyltransferase [Alkalimonas sp. MEB108]
MIDTKASWDRYWAKGGASALPLSDEEQDQLGQFWQAQLLHNTPQTITSVVELAAGCGDLTTQLVRFFVTCQQEPALYAVDSSSQALQQLQNRFTHIAPLQADLAEVPLADSSQQLVASQFGIEYGGEAGFAEAGRLVAVDGVILLLVHHSDSEIFRQTARNNRMIRSMQDEQFFAKASHWFRVVQHDSATTENEMAAARNALMQALQHAQRLLQQTGLVSKQIRQFYQDCADMAARVHAYRLEELISWLEQMEAELLDSQKRGDAMQQVAMDYQQLDALCRAQWQSRQLEYHIQPFELAGKTLGWFVKANKKPA